MLKSVKRKKIILRLDPEDGLNSIIMAIIFSFRCLAFLKRKKRLQSNAKLLQLKAILID